jgi:hypothetical protein
MGKIKMYDVTSYLKSKILFMSHIIYIKININDEHLSTSRWANFRVWPNEKFLSNNSGAVCCVTDGELGRAVGSAVCSLLCVTDGLWVMCVKSKMLAGAENYGPYPFTAPPSSFGVQRRKQQRGSHGRRIKICSSEVKKRWGKEGVLCTRVRYGGCQSSPYWMVCLCLDGRMTSNGFGSVGDGGFSSVGDKFGGASACRGDGRRVGQRCGLGFCAFCYERPEPGATSILRLTNWITCVDRI